MKPLIAALLTILTSSSFAQGERPWYEADESITLLHGPQRTLRLSFLPPNIQLFLPPTPKGLARLLRTPFPIHYTITPTPELASFITLDDQEQAETEFRNLAHLAPQLITTLDETGRTDEFAELSKIGIEYRSPTTEEVSAARKVLTGFPAFGRLAATRSQIPILTVAVSDLRYKGRHVPAVALSENLVFIDIEAKSKRRPIFERGEPRPQRAHIWARELFRTYTWQTGAAMWRQLPPEQREEFIDRFAPEDPYTGDTKRHPVYSEFVDAFEIACLFPMTFEIAQVQPFTLPMQMTPTPPTGKALEQVRFVDHLLDEIEAAAHEALRQGQEEWENPTRQDNELQPGR